MLTVYVVRFSNYEPAEIDSIWGDSEGAVQRCAELSAEHGRGMWTVEPWDVKSLPKKRPWGTDPNYHLFLNETQMQVAEYFASLCVEPSPPTPKSPLDVYRFTDNCWAVGYAIMVRAKQFSEELSPFFLEEKDIVAVCTTEEAARAAYRLFRPTDPSTSREQE